MARGNLRRDLRIRADGRTKRSKSRRRAIRRGDTIAVNAGAQGGIFAVGRLCDFNKAIVGVGEQVVRPGRRTNHSLID